MVGGSTISKLIAIVVGTYLLGAYAMAADGLTTIASDYGPKETMDRLEAEIKAKGMTVFARIDHAAGAAQAGPSLRPTEVLLFRNAKAGTPLMQANPLIDHIPPGWGDTIVLLGRILIGGIFVQSGFDKLMGLDAFAAGLAARGLPAALMPVLAPIGASVEFFGGLAIVFGLMTRCAA